MANTSDDSRKALMDNVAKVQREASDLDLPTGGEYHVSFPSGISYLALERKDIKDGGDVRNNADFHMSQNFTTRFLASTFNGCIY